MTAPRIKTTSRPLQLGAGLASCLCLLLATAGCGSSQPTLPPPDAGSTSCGSHHAALCFEGDLHWYDSCGSREELKEDCGALGCEGGACKQDVVCTPNTRTECAEGHLYWFDSCGVRGAVATSCGDRGCSGESCLPPAPVCGNGKVEAGEACDDGATAAGDGCSGSCAIEPGFACSGEPSVCTAVCVPKTCAELGLACGTADDGCSGTVLCGPCQAGQVCTAAQQCEQEACLGTFCAPACGGCASGELCGAGGPGLCGAPSCRGIYCWETPRPTGEDLAALAVVSPTDVLAGGRGPTLLTWDGARWATPAPPGGGFVLAALERIDPARVWAAFQINTGGYMQNIISELWKREAGTWTRAALPSTTGLREYRFWGLHAASSTEVYLYGYCESDTGSRRGCVYRWDGAAWTYYLAGSQYTRAVDGAAGSVWGVGDSGMVYQYGPTVVSNSPGTEHFNSVKAISPTEVWVGGQGGALYRWNGASWEDKRIPGVTGDILSLAGRSATEVFVLAAGTEGSQLWAYNGASFVKVTPRIAQQLTVLEQGDDGTLWAAGQGGAIARVDSSGLQPQLAGAHPPANLSSIAAGAGDELWATRYLDRTNTAVRPRDLMQVFHWNGTQWGAHTGQFEEWVNSTWVDAGGAAWAIGEGGSAFVRQGGAWRAVPTGTTTAALSTFSSPVGGSIWVGSRDGAGVLLSGSAMGLQEVHRFNAAISSLFARSDTDVYVVTSTGGLWHFDGASWSAMQPPGAVVRIAGADQDAVWFVNSSGSAAYEYRSGAWIPLTLSGTLEAARLVGGGLGFAIQRIKDCPQIGCASRSFLMSYQAGIFTQLGEVPSNSFFVSGNTRTTLRLGSWKGVVRIR